MLRQAFANFPCKIETREIGIFLFQFLDDAQALAVVFETAVAFHQAIQNRLAFVTEWGMTEIVRQCDGLRQIGIQFQSAGDVARDGRDLNCVRKTGAKVVAGAVEENLRLVFEPAERAGMNDPVAVALVMCAPFGWRLGIFAPAGIAAELGVRREDLPFDLFQFLSGAGHILNAECRIGISWAAMFESKSPVIQKVGEWCLRSSCSDRTRRR